MAKKKEAPIINYYLAIGVVNALVIFLAPSLLTDGVVLGTNTIPPVVAALIAGVVLTLVVSLVDPLLKQAKLKVTNEWVWGTIYGLVNIITVWAIARGAVYTGVGITSFFVAVVLGIVLMLLQWGVWKLMLGKK